MKARIKWRCPGEWTLRAEILRRDGFRCCYCGWKADDPGPDYSGRYAPMGYQQRANRWGHMVQTLCGLQIDHIVPYSLGGTNDRDNFQTLCTFCNAKKAAKYDGPQMVMPL